MSVLRPWLHWSGAKKGEETSPAASAVVPKGRGLRGYQVVRAVLGLLLLTAAGLKAYDPLAQDSFLGSPRLHIAAIETETLLGLWLLSGWSVRASWVSALGLFSLLAGVSLWLALEGQSSCGCLGRVQVSPWAMFALDLAALMALAIWRPSYAPEVRPAVWIGCARFGTGSAHPIER